MPDPSFDVVSEVDRQEVRNAVDQAMREITNRFDFKATKTSIDLGENSITITSATENRLEAARLVLQERLAKRQVSQKALDPGKVENASGGTVRQEITLVAGIDKDRARKITKFVKDQKLKVQAAVQGEQVRITSKSKDDLQSIMQALREHDFGIPLQFTNRR